MRYLIGFHFDVGLVVIFIVNLKSIVFGVVAVIANQMHVLGVQWI